MGWVPVLAGRGGLALNSAPCVRACLHNLNLAHPFIPAGSVHLSCPHHPSEQACLAASPPPPPQCPLTASCPSQPLLCNSTNDRGESFSFPCGTWTSYYR